MKKQLNTSTNKKPNGSELRKILIVLCLLLAIGFVLVTWRPWGHQDQDIHKDVVDTTIVDTVQEPQELQNCDSQVEILKDSTSNEESHIQDNNIPKKVENTTKKYLDLGYARYTGDKKNGQPHGNGEMVFTKRATIPGTIDFEAQPGERVSGTWRNGRVNSARLFHKNGTSENITVGQRGR